MDLFAFKKVDRRSAIIHVFTKTPPTQRSLKVLRFMQNEPHLFVYRAQRTNVNSRLYPSVGANNVACVSRVRCTPLTTRIDMYYNVYFQNVYKNQTLNSSLLLNHNNKCHNCKMYSELCLPKCHKNGGKSEGGNLDREHLPMGVTCPWIFKTSYKPAIELSQNSTCFVTLLNRFS